MLRAVRFALPATAHREAEPLPTDHAEWFAAWQCRRLREPASNRHRSGYRLLLMLHIERVLINHKKLQRLYVEERFQVCQRGGCKRALGEGLR
jgi:hypothetical protein